MGIPPGRQPDPRIASFEADPDEKADGPERRAARVRRVAAAGAAAGAILMLGLVVAGPVAKSLARSRARGLGLTLDVQSSSIGFGVVKLRGVSVSAPEVPAITTTFDRVDVSPGFGFRRTKIELHGGHVRVHGSLDEVERQVAAYQSRVKPAAEATSARAAPVWADGIDVSWSRSAGSDSDHAWGVRYERTEDGHERVGADLVQTAMASVRLRVENGLAAFHKQAGRRLLDSVSTDRITGTVTLDGDDDGDPAEAPKPAPTQRQKLPAKSDGHETSGAGERLRAALASVTRDVAAHVPPPGKISLAGVELALRHDGETLSIGPASVVLDREPDHVKVTFVPAARETATPVRFEARVPIEDGPVEVDLVGGPVSLAALGVKERDMGLLEVDRAEVEVAGHARWSGDGRSLSVSGSSRVSELALEHAKLAPEPVRGIALSLSGDGSFALDGSHAELGKVELTFGKIKLEMHGSLERADGLPKGKLHVAVPLAACSDVLGSVPSALAPLLHGIEATGTLAFVGDLEFDARRPGDTRIDWDAANECRVTRVPESLSPDRFKRPWVRSVLGADGTPVSVETGPGTDTWVPFADISPFMQTAIVICEDSRFFQHDGFDAKAIQDSIRNNLRAGKFLRGASTVSMQLAKNLYLGREKTLSRKFQEAVLTLLLEQVLTKEQILELYLNVIEFAPGVYGIGPAASYYFRSMPRDISLGQALYLASILPNPKNRHFKPDGALSDTWSEYLRKLMVIAHKIRRIDDHALAVGLAENVHFGVAAEPGATAARTVDDASDVTPPEDGLGAEGP